MICKEVAFADVFDGTDHFSEKAIIQRSLQDIAGKQGYGIVCGEDGLDAFDAVPLIVELDGGQPPIRLALWRHASNDVNMFAIQLELSRLREPGLLDAVLSVLGLSRSDVSWLLPDEERVTIERHAMTVGPPVMEANFPDEVIELTEIAEELVIAKTARVVEEVSLGKTTTERTETIKDTLRRGEVEIKQVPAAATTTSSAVAIDLLRV